MNGEGYSETKLTTTYIVVGQRGFYAWWSFEKYGVIIYVFNKDLACS